MCNSGALGYGVRLWGRHRCGEQINYGRGNDMELEIKGLMYLVNECGYSGIRVRV